MLQLKKIPYALTNQNMINKGYSDNDAESYALSYAFDVHDAGLKIYQKKNGDFKEQLTVPSGKNYLPKICP